QFRTSFVQGLDIVATEELVYRFEALGRVHAALLEAQDDLSVLGWRHNPHRLPTVGGKRFLPCDEQMTGQGDLFWFEGDQQFHKGWSEARYPLWQETVPIERGHISGAARSHRECQCDCLEDRCLTASVITQQRGERAQRVRRGIGWKLDRTNTFEIL